MSTDPRHTDHIREQTASSEDAGIPDFAQGDPPQKESIGVKEEGIIAPGEQPKAANSWGTTALEQAHGEPHGQRLRREEGATDSSRDSTDRLVDAPAGDGQAYGSLSGDASGLSAEEEAVRETDEPELA
ncbi:MAG TPA: hypothetical protein VM840_12650 [Actinomycetota bacterium]|nr:hypothetical protein [Actinomycetota bacterium]